MCLHKVVEQQIVAPYPPNVIWPLDMRSILKFNELSLYQLNVMQKAKPNQEPSYLMGFHRTMQLV